MARVDVGGQGALGRFSGAEAPEDLAGGAVEHGQGGGAEEGADLAGGVVQAEDLQALPAAQQRAGVQDGAAAQAGREEALAVVVHGHRAHADLVAAVAVEIGHGHLRAAVAGVAAPGLLAAVKGPAGLQFAVPEIPGRHDGTSVGAADKED